MASTPLTDDERQQIRDLHAAGHGCNQIARQLGRDRSTISRAANDIGLSFDRAQTRQATAARQADNAAMRAQLASDLLADAVRLRKQLWEPCTIHSFGGKDNIYNAAEVAEPPFRDKRDIMSTVGTAVDKALRLTDYDATDGAGEVASLLGTLFDGLRAKHGDTPPE
ncbi:helix-turn-helix domain-containing protein [Nonomuraea mangrovi]|uniref:Helix-turn-helix domain-containing protein n=1 Tax=Nonomuraea mangrovi TaxID=2316207 RepID=A0ABW4TEP0_9ACTN